MKYELLMDQETFRTMEYQTPYTYSLSASNGQVLTYFGSRHSYDPEDTQFEKLEEVWDEFLKSTEGKKRIVLMEGGVRPVLASREEAILKGGEMHYITYLAHLAKVDIVSPEPSPKEWFNALAEQFSKEVVAYYDFARVCYQWHKLKEKPSFEEYVGNFLEQNKQQSGWDFDFSLENMKKIHKDLFGTDFDESNTNEFFYSILDTWSEKEAPINLISRFDDSPQGLRDRHIVGEIEKYWNAGNNIFIIFGSGHAVIQEPLLRDLIK